MHKCQLFVIYHIVSCLADNAEAGSATQDESLLLVADSDGFQCNVYTGPATTTQHRTPCRAPTLSNSASAAELRCITQYTLDFASCEIV